MARLGHSGGFAVVMSGKGHGRHWASAPSCGSHGAKLGHIRLSVPAECSRCPEPFFTQGRAPAPSLGQHGTCVPGATRSVPGLKGREGSQPMGAVATRVRGCCSRIRWQPCLRVFPHPAAGDPALSCPPGRPSRSHSTMSLSVRPQRRVLVTKINRSQSFAGVNSTADRPFR